MTGRERGRERGRGRRKREGVVDRTSLICMQTRDELTWIEDVLSFCWGFVAAVAAQHLRNTYSKYLGDLVAGMSLRK